MNSERNFVLKWGKNVYDIQVENESGLQFKEKITKLTRIPVNRQNVICNQLWKGFLSDSYMFNSQNMPDYCSFVLLAPANDVVANVTGHQFAESLTESAAMEQGLLPPPGITNLINTCYANSVIQVLHKVPELTEAVKNYVSANPSSGSPGALVSQLRTTFEQLDTSRTTIKPFNLVNEIRRNETFGHREHGFYQQQDAEEFLAYVLNALASSIPTQSNHQPSNIVKDLFTLQYDCTYSCAESNESYTSTEDGTMLYCNIRGGANEENKVNFMNQGIHLGLESELDKFSERLNKTASWKKVMRIRSLPKFLCIQYMRFYWKELADAQEGGIACKIMRAVEFPFKLDIREFCTPGVQKEMDIIREMLESDIYQECVKEYEDNPELKNGILQSLLEDEVCIPTSSAMPVGFAGYYELIGIVSHMGDSVKGGHYVGWIKQNGRWFKCDDDTVTAVTKQQVRQLKGGSEAHSAYLCLYRYVDSAL